MAGQAVTPYLHGKTQSTHQYVNSHSSRCLQQAKDEKERKVVSARKVGERIEGLQAWEARRLLHREELRVQVETRQLQQAPFLPVVSLGTIRILKQQETRLNLLSESNTRGYVSAMRAAHSERKPISRTQTTASCPNSRATSPDISQIPKPHCLLKRPPKVPITTPTVKTEATKERMDLLAGKVLSPVYRMVSFQAGCDLEGWAKRAEGV